MTRVLRVRSYFSNGVGKGNDAAIVSGFDSSYFSPDGLNGHAKLDYGFALNEIHD